MDEQMRGGVERWADGLGYSGGGVDFICFRSGGWWCEVGGRKWWWRKKRRKRRWSRRYCLVSQDPARLRPCTLLNLFKSDLQPSQNSLTNEKEFFAHFLILQNSGTPIASSSYCPDRTALQMPLKRSTVRTSVCGRILLLPLLPCVSSLLPLVATPPRFPLCLVDGFPPAPLAPRNRRTPINKCRHTSIHVTMSLSSIQRSPPWCLQKCQRFTFVRA